MPWTPERLKALRAAFDMTQAEFAELVGVSRVTLNKWENGPISKQPIPKQAQNHLTLLEKFELPRAKSQLQSA